MIATLAVVADGVGADPGAEVLHPVGTRAIVRHHRVAMIAPLLGIGGMLGVDPTLRGSQCPQDLHMWHLGISR